MCAKWVNGEVPQQFPQHGCPEKTFLEKGQGSFCRVTWEFWANRTSSTLITAYINHLLLNFDVYPILIVLLEGHGLDFPARKTCFNYVVCFTPSL